MEFMDEQERHQQGNLSHDPMRHELFEFFMGASDDGEVTREQAILNTQAALGIISVSQAEGQGELFDAPTSPPARLSNILDH